MPLFVMSNTGHRSSSDARPATCDGTMSISRSPSTASIGISRQNSTGSILGNILASENSEATGPMAESSYGLHQSYDGSELRNQLHVDADMDMIKRGSNGRESGMRSESGRPLTSSSSGVWRGSTRDGPSSRPGTAGRSSAQEQCGFGRG